VRRRLSKNKKGDLGISTNAIVVLIIAVVMLSLIIVFVKSMFGNIIQDFEESATLEQDAPSATRSTPISFSRDKVLTSPGKIETIKIKAFNTLTTDVVPTGTSSVISPLIQCISPQGAIDLEEQSVLGYPSYWNASRALPDQFIYTFKVAETQAIGAVFQCRVTLYNNCVQDLSSTTLGIPNCAIPAVMIDGLNMGTFVIEVK